MEKTKSNLSDAFWAGLADAAEAMRSHLDPLVDALEEVVAEKPPDQLIPGLAGSRAELTAITEAGLADLDDAAKRRDLTEYLQRHHERYADLAAAGMSFRTITESTSLLFDPILDFVRDSHKKDTARAYQAIHSLYQLMMESMVVAGEVYSETREEKVGDEYRDAIRKLSTPVVQVWNEILLMPLVGILDSNHAREMMERLLDAVARRQSRIVILDVTGVPTIDSAVADHLIRTTKAARLVGARTLLVGISPEVAQALVRLGVSLSGVETFADLRSGLEHAMHALGYQITRTD